MVTALLRKSLADLNRRKARTALTVLTIAIGIGALGMFATMPLIDRTMQEEIERSAMYDAQFCTNDTAFSDSTLQEIEDMDNVRGVEARSVFSTKAYIGERRNSALMVGVRDFSDQSVDRVLRESGRYPGPDEVMIEASGAGFDLGEWAPGDRIEVYDCHGDLRVLNVSGLASTLQYSSYGYMGQMVMYAHIDTVHIMANTSGYNLISIDMESSDEEASRQTVEEAGATLSSDDAFNGFSSVPVERREGDWPVKEVFEKVGEVFSFLAVLILTCGVFLMANTMHATITEQRREIAQMKALGATPRQVIGSFLTTSLILGGTGSAAGAVLGIFIANAMAGTFAAMLGVEPGFGLHVPTFLMSITLGLAITVLASLPALCLTLRLSVREGLENTGMSANFGVSGFQRALTRPRWIPTGARMGVRNVSRRKGRSLATMLQAAVAVGAMLAMLSVCDSLGRDVGNDFSLITNDIVLRGDVRNGYTLELDMVGVLEGIEGVERADPFIQSSVLVEGRPLSVIGCGPTTGLVDHERMVRSGRWLVEEDMRSQGRVMVLARNVASDLDVGVGDRVEMSFGAGTYGFTVVGLGNLQLITDYQAFVPLDTMQEALGLNGTVNAYSIVTERDDHAYIDRTAALIEDTMLGMGALVQCRITYVEMEAAMKGPDTSMAMFRSVGFLAMVVTMIGLVSTLTMNVIERTREIGMFRCVGASSWTIAAVFATEGMMLVLGGCLIGIPLGYALGWMSCSILYDSMGMTLDMMFSPGSVASAVATALGMSLVMMMVPIWRAARIRPGDALRYQ